MSFPDTTFFNSSAPAIYAAAVTPSDSTDLTAIARALYVGVGGDIVADMPNGDTVTFVGVNSGTILPVRVKRVRATSTTATSIVALF